jgi:peroxiredoxin
MVMVASTMLPLGTAAPAFSLQDVVSGSIISLDTFAQSRGLLVMFICVHCPFVKHVQQELAHLGQDYVPQGLGIVAISANSIATHPQDGPEHLKTMAATLELNFPYCFDATQAVAKAYTAACTPDFFLFDAQMRLAYRGQLDDSRPSNGIPVTGQDLRSAMDAVLAGKVVATQQKPSIGCNIKWAPGQEPPYFGQ